MTKLSPMEEALFQAWARAHGVQNQDDPKNQFDHRGLYKSTNGQIMPGHVIRQMADEHNQAVNQKAEGGDTTYPDPYAAQAEMHAANVKAQSDQTKEQMRHKLEREKMQHKLMIEQMKLHHQSQEKDKDRAHKAQAEQMKVQQQAVQAEHQRQMDMQMAHQQRQYQVQDAQMNRQHQMEDAHMQRQAQVQDQTRQAHFDMQKEAMRPQPQPSMQGPQSHGPAPGGAGHDKLHSLLAQRMMHRG